MAPRLRFLREAALGVRRSICRATALRCKAQEQDQLSSPSTTLEETDLPWDVPARHRGSPVLHGHAPPRFPKEYSAWAAKESRSALTTTPSIKSAVGDATWQPMPLAFPVDAYSTTIPSLTLEP